ncbi:acyl-CoA dehydrogenase family protein [Myxococcus sp. K15C18031901]|uniref:acyl-CoA dehydrogenase family protein n=1 Tax=Myxococcus dinghuensis TaxID=2906761 RepID=UPI0020A7CEC6|nr:acyl-CoA dehydrogenase family protein [Myxococcus dinghuensis]MCP3102889.1 acyl-CoA dehydrogenase family protein [Myxococcus dinghuensis]
MRIDPEAVLEEIRRDDPESWPLFEAMQRHIPPIAARADADAEIPPEFWPLVPVDLQNRVNMPPQYGGVVLTATAVRRAVVFERIGRLCPALPIGLPGPGLSAPPVLALGTEEQKVAYFNRFLGQTRPVWGAFAITEPQGGSDAAAMRTVATRDGTDYVLNGTKCFITSGGRADVVVVFASLDPNKGRFAIRAFVVPRDTPGFAVDRCEDMMGLRASQLATLSFTDCRLPASSMLGHTGKRGPHVDAFTGAQASWDYMRPVLSSLINGGCLGMVEYAEQCLAEGEAELPRAKVEQAREELGVFRARISSSQMLALRAAWKFDAGGRASTDASLAKAFASTVSMELAHKLAAMFPVKAATAGDRIEKFYRDAKAFDILEGTGDMQRLMIARAYEH